MQAAQKYKIPSTNALVARITLEFLALFALGYPMLHIYVILQGDKEPYKRGFFCDDENLKHPILEEEISVGNCVIIWICIVLFIVPLVELLHFAVYKYVDWEERLKQQQERENWNCISKIPMSIIELYRMLGYFFVGALGTLLTTEMAKYKIGRLRPYFLTACKVDLTLELCQDQWGYEKFVTDYSCTGDEVEVREARKSFLSGHSSFSFYCSTFLIIYLQARLSRRQHRHCEKRNERRFWILSLKTLKVLRPFIQFGFFGLALYIAFTRISDYKHHPFDILSGIIVGVVFALIILLFLVDLFRRPKSFEERLDEYDLLGIQMESLRAAEHRCNSSINGDSEMCPSPTTYSEVDRPRIPRPKHEPDRGRNSRNSSAPLARPEDISSNRGGRPPSSRVQYPKYTSD